MVDYYGTAAGFRLYHAARGNVIDVDTDDAEILADLLVASEWLDGKYRSLFDGLKVGQRAQVREFPRSGGTDINGYPIAYDSIPTEIENATYEGAYLQQTTPGALSINWTPNKYKSVSIDGAVSATYSTFNSASEVQPQFIAIDRILAPILTGCGDTSMLSGASVRT